MYGYEWTGQSGIYRLSVNSKIEKEIRPVFKEELDYFGFNILLLGKTQKGVSCNTRLFKVLAVIKQTIAGKTDGNV